MRVSDPQASREVTNRRIKINLGQNQVSTSGALKTMFALVLDISKNEVKISLALFKEEKNMGYCHYSGHVSNCIFRFLIFKKWYKARGAVEVETLRLFNLSRWASALVIALNFAIPQTYAQGGKAEPLRVQFQRGRSSATIAGKLRGDQQAEYVAGAKKDQRLTINLYARPPGSITVKVKTMDGADLELKPDSKQRWSATLPGDGDYLLWVVRSSGKPGTSYYKLTVTIR
jgi:hypothetical protein